LFVIANFGKKILSNVFPEFFNDFCYFYLNIYYIYGLNKVRLPLPDREQLSSLHCTFNPSLFNKRFIYLVISFFFHFLATISGELKIVKRNGYIS